MSSPTPTQSMNMNAKERFEGMWATIRSMAHDQEQKDGTIQGRLKKAMDMTAGTGSSETLEGLAKVLFGACTTEFAGAGPDSPARRKCAMSPGRKCAMSPGRSSSASISSDNSLARRLVVSPSRGKSNFKPYKPQPHGTSSATTGKPPSRAEQKEEFFYAQFMTDDRHRAEQAVSSLRENPPSSRTVTPPPKVHVAPMGQEDGERQASRNIPKPFHVSTPPPKEEPLPVPEVLPVSTTSPTESSENRQMGPDLSFDDGISAISAYTLEEMARGNHGTTQNSRHDTATPADEAGVWSRVPYRRQSDTPPRVRDHVAIVSPASFKRGGPSFGSKGTYQSRLTKSTRSTNTTEFENAWKLDEKKYWQDVVEGGNEDEGQEIDYDISKLSPEARRHLCAMHKAHGLQYRSSGGPLPPKLQSNRTISTAGSSTYHSDRSPNARCHPHETLYLDASDCVPRRVVHTGSSRFDPDRIEEVLVLGHETELGEI